MERGKKNRTNIKKHVVRNPAMLAQTMRRRILFTGGSGTDSTTTDGALPAGFAGAFGAGGAATAAPSLFMFSSTAENLHPAESISLCATLTRQRRGIASKIIQFPATQGLMSV